MRGWLYAHEGPSEMNMYMHHKCFETDKWSSPLYICENPRYPVKPHVKSKGPVTYCWYHGFNGNLFNLIARDGPDPKVIFCY
jgi:hypothetical protein